MGTREDGGTRHFSWMINSPATPKLILFISFIRNEPVRALIYTAAPFIPSTTLSHTRWNSIFFRFPRVFVDSLPSFRRWRELIALQIVAEYKRFLRSLFYRIPRSLFLLLSLLKVTYVSFKRKFRGNLERQVYIAIRKFIIKTSKIITAGIKHTTQIHNWGIYH